MLFMLVLCRGVKETNKVCQHKQCLRKHWTHNPAAAPTVRNLHMRVGIIGGGVAGLQQARALRVKGVVCTVFDKAPRPGGVWLKNYESFGLQVPTQLYAFLDFPYKHGSCCADLVSQEYPSGAEVQAYIEAYVKAYDLEGCLALSAEVEKLSRRSDGKPGWTFHLASGKREDFDYCVVATGHFSQAPFVPAFDGAEAFEQAGGKILHSTRYTSSTVTGKRVVVVGSGKSGTDISIDSATTGRSAATTMLYRRAHWAAPRLLAWFSTARVALQHAPTRCQVIARAFAPRKFWPHAPRRSPLPVHLPLALRPAPGLTLQGCAAPRRPSVDRARSLPPPVADAVGLLAGRGAARAVRRWHSRTHGDRTRRRPVEPARPLCAHFA